MATVLNQVKNSDKYSPMGISLIATLRAIRESGSYAKIKKETVIPELSAIIAKHTLLKNVEVRVDPELRQNAYVMVPMLFKNNPMMYDYWREWFGEELEEDSTKALKKAKAPNQLDAWVDRAESKVYGWYQELKIPIVLSYDAIVKLESSWDVTAEEIVGILMHEIGHVFSFLIAMTYTARTNQVLYDAHKQLMGVGSVEDRVRILRQIAGRENIDIEDAASLAKNNNKDAITTVIVGGLLKQMRSELGNDVYDMRGFEALSDNFATKHGFGLELVTALDKMPSMKSYKAKAAGQFLNAFMELTINLILSVGTFGIWALLLFFVCNPTEKIYDDPKDRYQRIRNELLNQLKDGSLDKSRKQKLIADIGEIDKIMAFYHGKRGVYEAIYEFIKPEGRDANLARKLNQQFEKMANSDLYLLSAKVEQLS